MAVVLETTCCCLETSEVPVSKELLLSEPPEQLPIIWPRGGAGGSTGLGAGRVQPNGSTWPGSDLPREDQILPGVSPGGVEDQKEELEGPTAYRYGERPQSTQKLAGAWKQTTKSEDQMPNRAPRGQSRPGHQEQTRTGSSLPLLFLSDLSHPLKTQFIPEHACAPST